MQVMRRVRRIGTVFLAICILLIRSDFIVEADDESSDIRTVKAGVFHFEGYHMKDEDGALSGYGIEFLELVSEYSRLDILYTGYDNSWDEMLTMLKNGEIDVVTSARRTSDREKEYIQKVISGEKTITVTAVGDRVPYSYVENGELKGILPDYFASVMELTGMPYEIVIPEDRADYNAMVDSGGVSVVIDRLETDAVMEGIVSRGFATDAYMTTGVARVIRKDFLGDVRTAALTDLYSGVLIDREINRDAYRNIEIIRYPSKEDAVQAVLNRKVDAAYVYAYSAQRFVNSDASDSLYYNIVNDMSVEFRMYVCDSADHDSQYPSAGSGQ